MAAAFQRGDCILRPLKWYRGLSTTRGRRENGCFLIEGKRAVEQILRNAPDAVEELLINGDAETLPEYSGRECRILTTAQFSSVAASVHPQGVIAVVRIPEESYHAVLPENPGNRIVLLDEVQDPGNVGTIIRCAAAFNCSGLLLTAGCADPFGPKAVQASAGALPGPWIRRTDTAVALVAQLRIAGYRLLCADINGNASADFNDAGPVVVALGNEGNGLSEQVKQQADLLFSIPMNCKAVESLNVAVSGAIILFAIAGGLQWK